MVQFVAPIDSKQTAHSSILVSVNSQYLREITFFYYKKILHFIKSIFIIFYMSSIEISSSSFTINISSLCIFISSSVRSCVSSSLIIKLSLYSSVVFTCFAPFLLISKIFLMLICGCSVQ